MTQDEHLLLKNQLCFSLYASAKELIRLYQPLLTPLGLTYTQYIVLLVLWERDDVSVGELGAQTLLDTGTLTPLLKKLENAGLLVRLREKTDERVVRIRLSERGIALKREARDIPQRAFCAAGLYLEDAQRLKRELDALLSTLKSHS